MQEQTAVDSIPMFRANEKEFEAEAQGFALLDQLFPPGATREQVTERVTGWIDRYVAMRFGEEEPTAEEAAEEAALADGLRKLREEIKQHANA